MCTITIFAKTVGPKKLENVSLDHDHAHFGVVQKASNLMVATHPRQQAQNICRGKLRPGSPCTKDSSSLADRRRLGQDATNSDETYATDGAAMLLR